VPPPKSQKLLREELKNANQAQQSILPEEPVKVYGPGEKIKIKEVLCCNDFVAILQFRIQSNIQLDEKLAYKNEGMVVGRGPGLPGPDGKRVPSQLALGDVISFFGNATMALTPTSGHYAGQKVIFLPERSVICKLPKVPFEVVPGNTSDE
jgi:hypothetical protein